MPENIPWPRAIPFSKLQKSLAQLVETMSLDNRADFKLSKGKTRIPLDSLPLRLSFCDSRTSLDLHPETAMAGDTRMYRTGNILLREPGHESGRLNRETRLPPGQGAELGLGEDGEAVLPGSSRAVSAPLLTLKSFGEELLLRNHGGCGKIRVTPLDPTDVAQLVRRRMGIMHRLHRLLGAPIAPAEPETALRLLREVNAILRKEAHRPTDRRGMPGGLVSLPERMVPVILGDLGGRTDNLLAVLTRGSLLQGLEKGWACLLILGDAMYRESALDTADTRDMLAMLDLILRLKLRFPEQVFYLRGEHDALSEDDEDETGQAPSGNWRRTVKQARSKKYRKELEGFYELLPYIAASPRFIACHAAAPTTKADREMLIDIREYPALEQELTAGRLKRYARSEVKRLRKTMDLPPETPFIVGHAPPNRDGTLWLDLNDIEGHHQVYSGGGRWVGALAVIPDGLQPLRYPSEPLTGLYNSLSEED